MGSMKELSCKGVRGLVNWKSLYDISGLLTFQTNSVRHQNITHINKDRVNRDHIKKDRVKQGSYQKGSYQQRSY